MTQPPNVLVVDDSRGSLAAVVETLEAEGFRARSAGSGALALVAVAAERPDLILLDLRMPDIDGLEVCRRLKGQEATRDIPIIFLSAAAEVEGRVEGLRLGAADYVAKPFQRAELVARIRTQLELSRLGSVLLEQTLELAKTYTRLEETMAGRVGDDFGAAPPDMRYRLFFNEGVDARYVFPLLPDGRPGRFVECSDSACRMLGYTREELLRLSPNEIAAPERRDDLPAIMQRIRTAGSLLFDMTHVAKDGRQIPVEIDCRRIELDGRPNVLSTVRDVSDRKRAEAEADQMRARLFQAQKMESLGRLAGGIAHDFNNLLATMTLQLNLWQMEAPGLPDVVRDGVDELLATVNRAARLTNQLLFLGRRHAMTRSHHDLNAIVRDLVTLLQRTLGESIDLAVEPSADPLWFDGDAGMVEQVVLNLSINARDAMPSGGRLAISTGSVTFDQDAVRQKPSSRPGRFAFAQVVDTGLGIEREDIEHLFEPFFATKGSGGGTGLGLSIVHGIVAQHGGWTEVESRVGTGSTFTVYFPLVDAPEVNGPPPASPVAGPDRCVRILLVEHEALVRSVAARSLRKLGHEVVKASSAEEALEVWAREQGRFDLLLTDMVMPGGQSGLDLCRKLRQDDDALKVIVVSGYSLELADEETGRMEQVTYLSKPYDIRALALTIQLSVGPAGR